MRMTGNNVFGVDDVWVLFNSRERVRVSVVGKVERESVCVSVRACVCVCVCPYLCGCMSVSVCA